MADSDKRLRYYSGQFLQEQGFTAEQQYHLDRQRRHNWQLHTWGAGNVEVAVPRNTRFIRGIVAAEPATSYRRFQLQDKP